jgi:hypothetical protein
LKRIQRMPNIPLAYVSVYRRMSDIFHTLTYACTIRNSVTGPLSITFHIVVTILAIGLYAYNPRSIFNTQI